MQVIDHDRVGRALVATIGGYVGRLPHECQSDRSAEVKEGQAGRHQLFG